MPKDEIDPEDPLELCGVALFTAEDTSDPMTECFIEEFLRLGYGPAQVLALFRNPHYIGPNMVLQNRGPDYVRGKIVEVFGWWGRTVTLRDGATPCPSSPAVAPAPPSAGEASPSSPMVEFEPGLADPGGAAIPRVVL